MHHFTSRTYEWIVEGDIKSCFDEISHPALMDRVRKGIGDKRVLALVKAFLKAGILAEDGVLRDTGSGTPQGSILSPLVSNVALSVLDEHIAQAPGGPHATPYQRVKRRRLSPRPPGSSGTQTTVRHERGWRSRRRKSRCMVACRAGDGGRPSIAALQGEAVSHRGLLR